MPPYHWNRNVYFKSLRLKFKKKMNYNIRNNNVNLTQIHITLPDNYIQESFYYLITFITDVSRLLGQICTLTKILQEALFS